MKLLFLATIFLPPLLSYSLPMSCTEITISVNYTNVYEIKEYSAKFSMLKNETGTYVTIFDAHGFALSDNITHVLSGFCYVYGVIETCLENLTQNLEFTLSKYETHVELDGIFTNEMMGIFDTYIDDGTISLYDGILYSPEYPCSHDLSSNATICCTSFIPASEVVGNFSRCKYFKSRSIIHNPIDYSVIATTSMNYFLTDRLIYLKGNYSLATDVIYYINGHELESDHGLNGTLFLPRGDVKFFFSTYVNNLIYEIPNVRLFLIRNGQTLMKEGVPYTKENDCQYYSVMDNIQNMPASIEVCCKEFE